MGVPLLKTINVKTRLSQGVDLIYKYYIDYIDMKEFPKYIWHKTKYGYDNALKLVTVGNDGTAKYWRNAGLYTGKAEFAEDKLMVRILYYDPVEYVECTEEDWMEDNRGYLEPEYSYDYDPFIK